MTRGDQIAAIDAAIDFLDNALESRVGIPEHIESDELLRFRTELIELRERRQIDPED
jgi:hypothetical protein